MAVNRAAVWLCCAAVLFGGDAGTGVASGFDEALYAGVEWRLVGPFRGGRAGTVTGVRGARSLYYMGTAGGGVWRTRDGGGTWECISDGFFGGSIGAVAVAESDPNVIYAGEGEQTVRGDVSSGHGVWRSRDAGRSWTHVGLEESEHVGRIRVHPRDPDLVYVAAMGNLWKPNPERGLYRSRDGGVSWERVLFESDRAGAVDVVLDPNNPRILYASTWEVRRNGYRFDSGGPGSQLWKSRDGGDTWEGLGDRPGLPAGVLGIIGVTVSPVDSDRVWAVIEAEEGGVFRSDDAGATWQRTNDDRALRQRAWYYSRIYADTQQRDTVYVMNVSYHRSKDAGLSFESLRAPHGDHHDLWIDPDDNQRMAIADDGGAQVSSDAGESWTGYHNQPTGQFYRVTTDDHFPFRIYGAQQDNSTVRIDHRTGGRSISERHWEPTAGGESAHLAPDPDDPDVVYGGGFKGYLMRLNHRTGQVRSVNIWPDNPAGSGAEVMKYRFNWNFPLAFSPHDSDRLYAGSNHLHVSNDEGQSWQVISPDLTRADPETLASSGGPITQDNTGVEYYGTIFAIAESPHEPGVIWTGSDDGLVHVTRDGGATWQEVTPPTSPRRNMINCIEVSPFEEGAAYLAATAYKFGDYAPYLYRTRDYGRSWIAIASGIDPSHYARAIRADPVRPGLLYAGTERGVYVSFDDGAGWQPLQLNLPIVSIRDLHAREEGLIAATHGRSFWMIDDLEPLRQLNEELAERPFHLFRPKPAVRITRGRGLGRPDFRLQGSDHPDGAIFQLFVKDLDAAGEVRLEILTLEGEPVRSFRRDAEESEERLELRSGGDRFVWDLRYPGFVEFPGMILYGSPNRGPRAVPGRYTVRLTVGVDSVEQELEVVPDPRLPNTAEDYRAQLQFLIAVRDDVSRAHRAIIEIRALRGDLASVGRKLEESAGVVELQEAVVSLDDELSAIESRIHQTQNRSAQDPLNYGIRVNNRLAFLMADQQRGDFPPTDQADEVRRELSAELARYIDSLARLTEEKVVELEDRLREQGVPLLGAAR